MKNITPTYRRLTLDELTTLKEKFTQYLASQGIDASSWVDIRDHDKQGADQYLNDFSNIVFEDLLASVDYLINIQAHFIICVHCQPSQFQKVLLTHSEGAIDFRSVDLSDSQFYATPGLHIATKTVVYDSEDRKQEIFNLTEQGYKVSDGKLYKSFCLLLASSQES